MEKEEIKNIIRNYLEKFPEIEFAYIFGSFVTRDDFKDIDIGVYLQKDFVNSNKYFADYGFTSQLIAELQTLVKTYIDIVVLNEAGVVLATQVVNKGILLFDRGKFARVKIENDFRKKFNDSIHLRNIKTKYLKEKINRNAGS